VEVEGCKSDDLRCDFKGLRPDFLVCHGLPPWVDYRRLMAERLQLFDFRKERKAAIFHDLLLGCRVWVVAADQVLDGNAEGLGDRKGFVGAGEVASLL